MAFAGNDMMEMFPSHMTMALWKLESLELQITPRTSDTVDQVNTEALGILPHLLEQMTGLRRLDLRLLTAECIKAQSRLRPRPLDDTCYTYSQVFPHHCKFRHLQRLYLAGLAIDGLEMFLLLFHQMPVLQRLWLDHIDLLGGKWEGVVEAMRIRGAFIPRELLSFEGSFRQDGGQWWLGTPDEEYEECLALRAYSKYAEEGGHHPSLPADAEDSLSINYFHEIYHTADQERVRAFWLRIQRIEDRRI
ncbi:hypothetical protein IMSHALPRED_006100 [Imshaugia aleurites]|uniref:Uncharacterized protein n=1 Tax=Imshaugia aleurites TaxID=172621 RepID=A0A8H3IM61_9LECA|nr:hypothetical protein IMSHALPRED_006100 [Imshaugia aleurites]